MINILLLLSLYLAFKCPDSGASITIRPTKLAREIFANQAMSPLKDSWGFLSSQESCIEAQAYVFGYFNLLWDPFEKQLVGEIQLSLVSLLFAKPDNFILWKRSVLKWAGIRNFQLTLRHDQILHLPKEAGLSLYEIRRSRDIKAIPHKGKRRGALSKVMEVRHQDIVSVEVCFCQSNRIVSTLCWSQWRLSAALKFWICHLCIIPQRISSRMTQEPFGAGR